MSYSICFPVWLISLTIIPPSPSMLLQMVTFILFWQSAIPLCVYRYVHPPPSSLPIGWLHVLAVVTGAAVNTGVLLLMLVGGFSGFPWEKIAESCCCCCGLRDAILLFFHSGCTDSSPQISQTFKNRPEFKSRLPMFPWSGWWVSHLEITRATFLHLQN